MPDAIDRAMAMTPGSLPFAGSILWQVTGTITEQTFVDASQRVCHGKLCVATQLTQVYRQVDARGRLSHDVLRDVDADPIPGMVLNRWIWRDGVWCGAATDEVKIKRALQQQRDALADDLSDWSMIDERTNVDA